jgi:hypothetical protein
MTAGGVPLIAAGAAGSCAGFGAAAAVVSSSCAKPATLHSVAKWPKRRPVLMFVPEDVPSYLWDALQIAVYLAVILLAVAMAWQMRGIGRVGNRIQVEIDLQVFDLSANALTGELIVVLQNMGQRHQDLHNLFIEVRPSRQVASNGVPLVPPVNMIGPDLHTLSLAPGVRQLVTWTFEIPRDEKLLRATAAINTGRRLKSEVVPSLSQSYLAAFGSRMRYASRVFEVAPVPKAWNF